MRRNKLAWILLTGALCLVLYTIVVMRSDNKTTVILGGLDGAFVESDSLTFVDPNAAVETPEPTVDIWPQLDIEDFDNPQYMIVNADNFLSAAYAPAESGKISGTNNQLFDATALPYLEQMLQDCRDAGFTVYVTAAFRSRWRRISSPISRSQAASPLMTSTSSPPMKSAQFFTAPAVPSSLSSVRYSRRRPQALPSPRASRSASGR